MAGWSTSKTLTFPFSSLNLSLSQTTTHFEEAGAEGFVFFNYYVCNESVFDVDSLAFGFLVDFDLSIAADHILIDHARGLIVQRAENGSHVGLLALVNVPHFASMENANGKRGLSDSALYDVISGNDHTMADTSAGDWMFIAGHSSSGRAVDQGAALVGQRAWTRDKRRGDRIGGLRPGRRLVANGAVAGSWWHQPATICHISSVLPFRKLPG